MRALALVLALLAFSSIGSLAAERVIELPANRAVVPSPGAAVPPVLGVSRIALAPLVPLASFEAPPLAPTAATPGAPVSLPQAAAALDALNAGFADGLQTISQGGLAAASSSGDEVVARLQGAFLIGASAPNALEPSASEFIVSQANFEVSDEPTGIAALMDEMRNIKDQEARSRVMLARAKLEKFDLTHAGVDAPLSRPELEALAKRLPAVLSEHFQETLANHEIAKTVSDGIESYRVKNGLQFWLDFASPADPQKRAAAAVFLHSSTRRLLSKDPAYRLVAALTGGPMAVTRVVDSARLTPSEWQGLSRLAEERGLSFVRFGRYGVIGSGASFHLTNEVLISAQDVRDPVLQRQLERVLNFLARRGSDVTSDENVGAAAFFKPMENRLAYVMPSRADLNVFSHESTHARFHEFEKQLGRWSKSRGLAIPYEVDGPFASLFADFGGFMNLLNELNSWRTGESFDGGKSDQAILDILRDSYGRQAGAASAALFASLWPATKVAGISVPRLILSAVRALNLMGEADLPELARRPDEPSQQNFLRLAQARYQDGVPLPAEVEKAAVELARAGVTDGVKDFAKRWLESRGKAPETADAAQSRDRREYGRAAGQWIEGFASDKIKVFPGGLHFGWSSTFRFAAENKIFAYDEAIRLMRARWGAEIVPSDDERALFARITAAPGATWEEKMTNYLTQYNETGFDPLWAGFRDKPSYDLRALLVEKHKGNFKPEHLRQLALWALQTGTAPELQSASGEMLAALLDGLGFGVIYAPEQLKSLQSMQRAMNEKNGRPADAYMPANRPPNPGHWLFSRSIDEALSQAMFDGKPGSFRLKMIELITQRTYPEELPLLRARLLEVITDPKIDRFDQWVARMFLIPSSQIFSAHVAWGEAAAAAVLADPAPNATALEFVCEFYRLGLGEIFLGPAWGKFNGNLDSRRRTEAEAAVANLPTKESVRYHRALDELWRLLGSSDRKVRAAALYAIAFRPVFLAGLEDRLAAELSLPSSPYRLSAVKLAGMMRPGFSPKIDAVLEGGIGPTKTEAAFLRTRPAPKTAPASS